MKTEIETPQERLALFIKSRFPSKTAFAKAIGMTPMDLQRYVKNNGSIFRSADKYNKLTELGLNTNWYIEGTGEMLLSEKDLAQDSNVAEVTTTTMIQVKPLDKMTLEEMRKYKQRIDEDLPKLERILSAAEDR